MRPVGTRAVLAELSGLPEVLALQAILRQAPLPGQIDVVAAAETVMVKADSAAAVRRIRAELLELVLDVPIQADDRMVVIETVYDGEDLTEVGELTGLGVEGVIAAHTGQTWTVAFAGFAPGFGYMVGENQLLEVSRRSSPRTDVPAGAVALAGNYSAVYPRESPGGWQLIGHTAAVMWDLARAQPALVRPGNRVQYRAVRSIIALTPTAKPVPRPEVACGLRILSAGIQSLIQDLGRPGHGELGVSAAGALDRGSLNRANRLAGNPSSDAGVEVAYGRLSVEAVGDQVLAVTGAPVALTVNGPDPDGDDRTFPMASPFALRAGEVLTLGVPATGLRSYLAARGGLDVPVVLGSRSTDTMSGIGPDPLKSGDVIPVGTAPVSRIVGKPELQPEFPGDNTTQLDILLGPRADWFDSAAIEQLCSQAWVVTPQSNRIGIRLAGTPLQRTRQGELPSEGTMAGAIQIPPAGLPVLFLADHPITGGYPVIGVVVDEQLDLVAQIRLGGSIRFRVLPAEGSR